MGDSFFNGLEAELRALFSAGKSVDDVKKMLDDAVNTAKTDVDYEKKQKERAVTGARYDLVEALINYMIALNIINDEDVTDELCEEVENGVKAAEKDLKAAMFFNSLLHKKGKEDTLKDALSDFIKAFD